jgi:phenylalanyl-tRNA synthetase beta chain
MKVSLNLAQYYSNVDLKKIPHDTLLQRIGAQLGAVEEVIDWAPKYQKIVVAKVLTCEQHPNADRLHVCTIDDGGITPGVKRDKNGYVQVVCGAPNVREGLLVAWIPPGATVPTTYGTADPFVLEARELRGIVSNGMLASAKELGISDDHDGILEINEEELEGKKPKPGDPLTNYFGLDDFVVDCENKMFTHRPDCFGNLGVARELAGISGLKFKSPDWYLNEPTFETKSDIKLTVKNNAGKLVPRFMAVAMKNVTVGKSPVWLQAALARAGIKSINNVVDVTNFVMHLTGQPLHAFDYDKLESQHLGPRMGKKGEKLKMLNGKEIELTEDDIVIATDKQAVALAGIMGGSETEVDEATKNIVIECATFDMYTIRRSSMRHGLFTDASTRYTKGQSPLQNARVLWLAMDELQKLAGVAPASTVYDVHGKLSEPADVVVTAEFINERLGSKLSLKDIAKLLENVEFQIKSVPADKTHLHIRPPFWRTDIEMPEDVVEEVGRLYGFDKLPVTLPARTTKPAEKNPAMDLKMHLRHKLKETGANEVLTYSFVHGDLMKKVGQDPEKALHIRNAISPDLQYYRLSVLPSLLDKVQANIRADIVRSDDNEFALFEIGKAHVKGVMTEEAVPKEFESISMVFAADDKTAARKYDGSPYYQARKYLMQILPAGAVFEPIDHEPSEEIAKQALAPFERARTAAIKVGGRTYGFVGEIRADIRRALKLPQFSAGFEIGLMAFASAGSQNYQVISQFPKIQQDITFEVSKETTFAEVEKAITEGVAAAADEHGYNTTLIPRDIFAPEASDKKRFTFRIWLSHQARTLTTDETNKLLDTLSADLKQKLNAQRI